MTDTIRNNMLRFRELDPDADRQKTQCRKTKKSLLTHRGTTGTPGMDRDEPKRQKLTSWLIRAHSCFLLRKFSGKRSLKSSRLRVWSKASSMLAAVNKVKSLTNL
jgi:hypothetical protein